MAVGVALVLGTVAVLRDVEPGASPTPDAAASAPVDEEPDSEPVDAVEPASGCSGGGACVAWADPITDSPLDPTADIEVAADTLVVAERIAPLADDEIAIEVHAVDLEDGTPRWGTVVTAPAAPEAPPSLALAGSWVIVADCAQVSALGLEDGAVSWQVWFDAPVVIQDAAVAPADDPEVIVVVTSLRVAPRTGWTVTTVDIDDGTVRWQREVSRAAATADAVVVDDGADLLSGLDPLTGASSWQRSHPSVLREPRSLAGAVSVQDWSGAAPVTQLLSSGSGDLLLSAFTAQAHPAVVTDQTGRHAAVVTTGDHIALVEHGAVAWTTAQPAAPCCSGSHVGDDEVVVQLADGSQLVLDRDDGALTEQRDALADEAGGTTTLVGRFLVVSDGPLRDRPGPLRFVQAEDGREIAVHRASQLVAALPDGDVLVHADGGIVRVTVP